MLKCSRCLRTTHSTDQCHAKKDILGKELSDFTTELLKTTQAQKDKKVASKTPQQVGKKIKTTRNGVVKAASMMTQKRKECQLWLQGKCVLGERCFYSHDNENGWDRRSRQLCQFYRSGSCMKSEQQCVYSHDMSLFACAFHHFKGGCKKGDSCPFDHGPLNELQMEEQKMDQERFEKKKQNTSSISQNAKEEDLLAIYRVEED